MAVSITNNLTTPTNGGADATTGWSGSATLSVYTTFEREASGCLGIGGNNSDEDIVLTIGSTNFTNTTLFGWMQNGAPGTTSAIGFGLVLGDGTNDRVYAVGGNDNYGHFVNGWSGFRLDSSILPATTRNITGTGAPTLTTITQIGYGMNYSIGAFGKIDNMFGDIIRYIANGSAALTVGGGTNLDRGTWAEIVAADQSTADGAAYGVARLLTSGSKAYELTYGIEIGSSSTNSYFADSNFQIVIVGTNMSAGNMDVDLLSVAGSENLFSMTDGVLVGVDEVSNWDMTTDEMNTFEFDRMTCSDLGTIQFPGARTGATRQSTDCIFNNCAQVSIGANLVFSGHSFNGTTDANGALVFDSTADNTNASDLTFNSDGSGHGLVIVSTGSYTLDNFTFNNFGADGTTDAAIFNNSGGSITITVAGAAPTVRDGTNASTTVIAGAVTTTITTTTTTGTPIENVRVLVEASNGLGDLPFEDSVTIAQVVGQPLQANVAHTAHGLSNGDKVAIRGANETQYNGAFSISNATTNNYEYTMPSDPGGDSTGTITSTGVVIEGLTNVSGVISASRTFSVGQPITGTARKSTSSPFYKAGTINGLVNNSIGFSTTVAMVGDE